MKNFTKVIALLLVLSISAIIFASCGNTLSGKYDGGIKGSYEFSGNKFTFKWTIITVEGTYKIDGDKIMFTFDGDENEYLKPEMSFEKTDDGIKIGGFSYKKD